MTHIQRCSVRAAMKAPAPGPVDPGEVPNLKEMGPWTRGERLRLLWYRLRLTVTETKSATRRMVELQVPWISDDHPGH